MLLKTRKRPMSRGATVGVLTISAMALTACGDDTAGSETGADVAEVQEEDAAAEGYDGLYDSDFYDDAASYDGQQVTLSADVNNVISPMSFTIAGTEDTTVEPMLVVSANEVSGLEPDLAVAVTGTVHKAFDLPTVEEELGVDLDDELYQDWDGEPYVEASNVDTSVAADQ